MSRSFGSVARAQLSGTGKSFFLHDLLAKVVFAESGWVTHDKSADRRTALLRYGGFAVIGLLASAALGAFGLSFMSNRALIASTSQAVGHYRTSAAPELKAATVADVDLENVIGPLQTLRDLPAGYAARTLPTPAMEGFGLNQRARLLSASETAYRQALERMFRSRLLLQLEQTIQASIADPAALYEPLKIYLMLGGKAPSVDDEAIVSWMKRDWETNRYPGVNNRAGRADLEGHLRAMLALDDEHAPLFEINRPLVEAAQRSLGRMSVADRATALLNSAIAASAPEDFSVSLSGGPEAPLVFEAKDGSSRLDVPGIYTFSGFHDVYPSATRHDRAEADGRPMGDRRRRRAGQHGAGTRASRPRAAGPLRKGVRDGVEHAARPAEIQVDVGRQAAISGAVGRRVVAFADRPAVRSHRRADGFVARAEAG